MRFRWNWGNLVLGLLAYWFVSTIPAQMLRNLGQGDDAVRWIVLTMLVFVIACMATERGQWKTWQRLGFVPLAWIVHLLLSLLAFSLIGAGLAAAGKAEMAPTASAFSASIPVVLYAARRSVPWVCAL